MAAHVAQVALVTHAILKVYLVHVRLQLSTAAVRCFILWRGCTVLAHVLCRVRNPDRDLGSEANVNHDGREAYQPQVDHAVAVRTLARHLS